MACRIRLLLFGTLFASWAGCSSPPPEFQTNLIYVEVQRRATGEVADETVENLANVVTSLFGTPNDPHLPSLEDANAKELLDEDLLQMAAGNVSREESGRPHGLYREHCAHCHGITGDGAGPTAKWLNPYPRDYRRGLYKFKSTPLKTPPAHEDLMTILKNGIPGTAMPSFKLLAADELESLVEYVKYLSIRGEVERSLITEAASELDEGALFVDPSGGEDNRDVINDKVASVLNKWSEADTQRVAIPQRPELTGDEMVASINRGRDLFHGKLAQCSKCHGETALGDGVQTDYDDWTKELEPNKPEVFAVYEAIGAFPARNAIPRNLRLNVFRGGRRPIEVYRRIKLGITGSPMPAASPQLQEEQIWDIVNYVRNLPFETASEPPQTQPAYQRDRL